MLDAKTQHHHPIKMEEHYVGDQRYVTAHCPACALWDAVRVDKETLVHLGEFSTKEAAIEAITKDWNR